MYIVDQTPKSVVSFVNLKEICEERLTGKFYIEIIDLLKNPKLARENEILATPTVVRTHPLPVRKIVGDLSNKEKALTGLGIYRLKDKSS